MRIKKDNRDYIIDFLRVIGTLLIVLDHCFPPSEIKTFCLFDVPLLVYVSGLSLASSNRTVSSFKEYIVYISKRIKRLVLPTWITIGVVVLLNLAMYYLGVTPQRLTYSEILRSFFFLQKSIGYVWIVRVYLLIAFASPLYLFTNKKIKNDVIYYGVHVLIIAMYYIVFNQFQNPPLIIKSIICYLVPYGFIFALGVRGKNSNLGLCVISIITFLTVLALIVMSGIQNFLVDVKYPPLPAFIVHGIFWSCSLTMILKLLLSNHIVPIQQSRLVVWFSRNSFDIYLAHILLVLTAKWVNLYIPWAIEWIGVVILSSCIVLLKNMLLQMIFKNVNNYKKIEEKIMNEK